MAIQKAINMRLNLRCDGITAAMAICLVGLLVSVGLHNRSFIVGYLGGVSFLACVMFRPRKGVLVLIAVGLLLLTAVIAYLCKTDSTLGRLLIYKIAWSAFSQNYLHGVGLGQFNRAYMLCQAEYFKSGNYTAKELLLAGNVYCAYNDYLQLAVELGLAGVCLTVLCFALVARCFVMLISSNRCDSAIVSLAMAQVVAMGVAACFTFVFERPAFQLILLCCLAILAGKVILHQPSNRRRYLWPVFCAVAVALSAICVLGWSRDYRTSRLLAQTQELSDAGYKGESLSALLSLNSSLGSNAEYLHQLATAYYDCREFGKALAVLKRESALEGNGPLYRTLGRCYLETGDPLNAERALITAVSMVPHRFTERLELYKLYLKTRQAQKGEAVKRAILALPVKVPSGEVDLIKRQLEK